MKYIDVKSVVESYKGFQDSMTNKSWGYLALLKGCNDSIRPLTPYEVNMDIVSNFLEGIFNLSQTKRKYSGGRSLYVLFSNKWENYFNDQGRYTPNIYDVAVWAYRRKAFPDDITEEKVISEFSNEFNIPYNVIKDSFNTSSKRITFANTLYPESILKTELVKIGVDVLKNNIDSKKGGVVAAPGEISRGPFIQTLYAGLDITDYVLILQSNYNTLYGGKTKTRDNDVVKPTHAIVDSTWLPYLTAIRTKPFLLLAGISGTGKSRIVRELAFKSCPKYLQDKDGTTPGNYCMIEVKPNWHDSTELLGYYSNLSKSYQFKKFVKFLVKAKLNPDVPFFVCLDEMNLAPVEHYFAEILSIIETRKHPKKDNSDEVDMNVIKTGSIVESQYFKEMAWKDNGGALHQKTDMTDRDWYEYFFDASIMSEGEKRQIEKYQYSRKLQEEGLTLPDNVIIIGTVNMDDTTHQFSRKVIDRAMTIEMNGGKLSEMYGGSKNLEYLSEDEQQKWQGAFRQRYVTADEVLEAHKDEAKDIIEKVPARLEEINKALKATPFEVSYRVLNELTIMIGVMLDEQAGEDIDSIINKAVDRILLMKILPRIEGDSDMFNLSQDFQRKQEVKYANRLEWLKELAPAIVDESDETYPQTARGKIQEMIERLENQEFTRFWP